MTKRQLEQFKKYSQKLLLFCCFPPPGSESPSSRVFHHILWVIYGHLGKRKSGEYKKDFRFYNAEREKA